MAVSARTAGDIWAVGRIETPLNRLLTMHWDGTAWTDVPSPEAPDGEIYRAVAVLAADDAWAAGTNGFDNEVEHWDGTAWHHVPAATFGIDNEPQSLAARAPNDIWLSGYYVLNGLII